jgi:hypothetical protein
MFFADLGSAIREAFCEVFPDFELGTCVQHRKVKSCVLYVSTHCTIVLIILIVLGNVCFR